MNDGIWRPSVTVAAVIEQGGKFLFVEEVFDGRKVLNQPAGHLDPGESLVHACAREVMEETAHEVRPQALVGVYRWNYKEITYLRFCFSAQVISPHEGRKLDKEIVRLHWLDLEELKKRKSEHRSPLVQRCVEDYVAGRRYPLEILSADYA